VQVLFFFCAGCGPIRSWCRPTHADCVLCGLDFCGSAGSIYQPLLKIFIHENFLANLLKKFARKDFFPAIFFKNFNCQVILSWVIIFYKIIKFVNISYKIYTKNVLYKIFHKKIDSNFL